MIIEQQGKPILRSTDLHQSLFEIVRVNVGLKSKYCHVKDVYTKPDEDFNQIPCVVIETTQESLRLGDFDSEITILSFPEYANWYVWQAVIRKDNLYLILEEPDDN